MYKIIDKKILCENICKMTINAPLVSKNCEAGQFIILRVDEGGERIPLTIAGYDRDKGYIDIIFQNAGATTLKLYMMNVGDYINDFVGPLGNPTIIEKINKICIIAGGVGTAIALPIAKSFKKNNSILTSIIGFKNKNMVILEDEFTDISDDIYLTTDDGSYGKHGLVTDVFKDLLLTSYIPDKVICIGPLIMMKNIVDICKVNNIPIICSMNSLMIDGTGMCGCCRITVNENNEKKVKFACVDGPDFDGYNIDFDEAIYRSKVYNEKEKIDYEKTCNLFKKVK